MKITAVIFSLLCLTPNAVETDVARWEREAQRVTIVRDDWGIPHIYGSRDADVVFGLMYAQAEDDFNRVETNYLKAMGRVAEAEGESEIYRDLRMKLFVDPTDVQARYAESPLWLKALMMAWADGLNFYLYKHPEVKPRVITRFEPWMALTWTDGNVNSEYDKVSVPELEAFYANRAPARALPEQNLEREPSGSNGIAIAPQYTVNHRALLLINPHTSLMFRAEAQLVSNEGLNSYGAITWGQFFVFQGFNEHAGWMHTSTGADAVDEYLETIEQRRDGVYYRYGSAFRKMTARTVPVRYKTASGMATKEFTVYRSHHGPVVRAIDGKWVTMKLMYAPVKALTQSYTRMKTRDYPSFRKIMDLHTNSTNNTIFADAKGNIAYFHANFVPRRDPHFDFSMPVDGSTPATEWRGVHSVGESPLVVNPATGWLYNTNNWPYSAAGPSSPKRESFPSYMDRYVENPRGIHAIRVLGGKKDFTLESLIAAAYDSYLPAFDDLLPPLFADFDRLAADNPLRATLAQQIGLLREWDRRWSAESVPTTLAVRWGEEMARGGDASGRLTALAAVSNKLEADFGSWKTPWGRINRFQRITSDIVQPFNDAGQSIAVPFTSSRWGSLASLGTVSPPGMKKQYGTSGNSFVAVVEFGDSVRAKAVSAGGQSGDPKSPHFNDQAERYSAGNLRDVYFYARQLRGHTERTYHPGH